MRITGYDLKKAIYTNMEADIPEPGSVLVGARLFCEMLRRMPDGIVTVEAENGTVSPSSAARSSFNLVGMSAEDYPDLPSVEAENGVSLPQDLLKKMINECSFAVSTNESRPVYMGTLFEIAHNEPDHGLRRRLPSGAAPRSPSRATATTAASSCRARR
ncbi:MAG: hypothetical protein ACLUNO_01925 [Oscillospiraceae bacterium]